MMWKNTGCLILSEFKCGYVIIHWHKCMQKLLCLNNCNKFLIFILVVLYRLYIVHWTEYSQSCFTCLKGNQKDFILVEVCQRSQWSMIDGSRHFWPHFSALNKLKDKSSCKASPSKGWPFYKSISQIYGSREMLYRRCLEMALLT